MSRIFRNKFYAGVVVSKKYGVEVPGQHPPMITEELFYRVQAILDGRNHNTPTTLAKRTRSNPDFPLRRIVHCDRCGQSFTGAWSRGKNKKNPYGYYFCIKRCGEKSNVPFKLIEADTSELLQSISLKPETAQLINAFLRRSYSLRIGGLRQKRDHADIELKKIYETRQALIEKNLNGTYSDAIFKEQNKILEEKIATVQVAKDETVIEKYNLEAITKFIETKFTDIEKTYNEADLERKRVLLCSIFPQGLRWSYPGYSNTQISPFYRCFLNVQTESVTIGAGDGTLTRGLVLGKDAL